MVAVVVVVVVVDQSMRPYDRLIVGFIKRYFAARRGGVRTRGEEEVLV